MPSGTPTGRFSPYETAVLARLFDIVIPQDEDPGGWYGGVERLLAEHGLDFMAWSIEPLRNAVRQIEQRARSEAGREFLDLDNDAQTAIFCAIYNDEIRDSSEAVRSTSDFGNRIALSPLATVIAVGFEGFYGGTREPAGWKVAGFTPLPVDVTPVDTQTTASSAVDQLPASYDTIVIGAGAGGGVAAAELAEAGQHVLLIERGRELASRDLRGNHLQGKRLAEYDVIAGPGPGNPRVLEHPDGSTTVLLGEGSGYDYGLVAMTPGGGTRLWQGMSWRFYPEDFAMADVYGTPEGSTLANWPFGYEELEPYYQRIEWELGVAGDGDGVLGARTPRKAGYPMPPMPDDAVRAHLARSATTLGWATTAIPFAINTVPRAGRAACVHCFQCVGHTCPVDAKNGTQNTYIPRALATGNAHLLTSSQVIEIEHDGNGQARGVQVVTQTRSGPVQSQFGAKRIVVAAGALETPRLLLASGLGNDWVGRNHHSHGIAMAIAAESPHLKSFAGPGHSIASLEFVHSDREGWGGGVLFDMPPQYPLALARSAAELGAAPYGSAHKAWMRRAELPLGVISMVQEIPDHSARVSLDPRAVDRLGMPALRIAGSAHPATIQAARYMAERAERWVAASGGRSVRTAALPGAPQGAEHSAGTVRFGSDPSSAACDPQGRLFGTSNVYVADASLHPTNGGFNPGLTVMANALRIAHLMPIA